MRIGVLALLWKIYVGIMFGLTAVIMYPFLALLVANKKWHKTAFKGFTIWSWFLRILTFYHMRRTGLENLPQGPYIITPNHASYLDIFLLPSALPQHPFLFMGKSEILSYPLIRTYFRNFNIPVYRKNRLKAAKSYLNSKKAVQDGWSLVIFAEGGIPDSGKPKMMPFKNGAFMMAKELKVPIVPVTFTQNHKLFSDPMDWFGYCRPGISKMIVHTAIMPEEFVNISVEELTKKCFDTVNAPLLELYPHLKE